MQRTLYALALGLAATALPVPQATAQTVSPALVEKAESEGVVRVIARIAVPFQPETLLGARGIASQRAMISSAQEEIAEDVGDLGSVAALGDLPLAVVETDAAGLAALEESGLVAIVVEDRLAEPTLAQSTPLIGAPDAWNAGFSGNGQTVAILDTGVEASHPFLAGKVVSQACFSTTSAANGGSVSFCPNGSGTQTGGDSGRDCPSSVSGCGHGTHVAGIAAGNGASFSGVARDADLIAIQVFSRFESAATCSPRSAPCALSYTSDQIRGLQRVRDLASTLPIASVNMSLGGGKFGSHCDDDPRKAIIDELRALDIATVVASGNDGFSDGIGAPACISTAISVGSTDKSDNVSGFSNSAAILDVLAPGSSINSSVMGGGFGIKSGTSMATPHVAGAFAVGRSANPGATVTALLGELTTNGQSVTGKGVTKPRIDLAYLAAQPQIGSGAPLAFGTLWFDGSKQSGTPNWNASFNPTYSRYEITISGQNYYYLDYTTAVTPAGDTRFCKSSSLSGNLLVYCYDADGKPATARIGFVTYKN